MDPERQEQSQEASGSASASSGFQTASSMLQSNHAPSANSLRNASGNIPAVPKPAVADAPAGQSGEGSGAATSGSGAAAGTMAPPKPVNRPAASKNAIIYSVLQRRNPVLALIRNVGLEIGDIVVDYQVGTHNGVLFLSLKYHRLHPEYIHTRIEKMRHSYNLRIMLVLCDINEHQQPLRELSKVAIVNEMTMVVAFSNEEAAQYLTTFKAYEHKSADVLKEKVHQTYHSQLDHVLTSGRKVNKSNAEAIAAQFGPFDNIVRQTNHSLSAVKGLGKVKVVSLLDAFNKPFVTGIQDGPRPTRAGASSATSASATAVQDPGNGQSPEPPEVDAAPEPIRPDTPPTPKRPTDQGPSRSPSIEPDDPDRVATDTVWADPLADDGDGDDDDDDEGRQSKRPRL